MTKPLFPWMGGKRRLAEHIFPLFSDHTCYVEPFCGGAALLFLKSPSDVEVINDVNGELVNLYRVVKHHPTELYAQYRWVLVGRQQFEIYQHSHIKGLTDIQRAARFLFLQKTAFGGKIEGQTFGTATTSSLNFNLLTIEQDLEAAHLRLARVCVEELSWQDCIRRYDRPHTLFYCDPPYWKTAGYGVEFGWDQYVELAEFARTIQGKILISHVDNVEIRALFSGLPVVEIDHAYTVGGATKNTSCKELVFGNWPDGVPVRKVEQSGLFD